MAAHARRRRHVADVLLCGAPDGHQHSCSVAACRLPGSFVKSARATGWISVAVLHRSSVSRALWQEAAAALASSTALVTGYLCKRGRQCWLVSESDASANYRGSNRPLSARRTASSKSLVELSETRAKPKRGLEPCIRPKRARARLAESAGRSRVGCAARLVVEWGRQKTVQCELFLASFTTRGRSAHLWYACSHTPSQRVT